MTITKAVRISKKGQFVIPKEMREAMGVKEGEEILVSFEEGIKQTVEWYLAAQKGSKSLRDLTVRQIRTYAGA